MKRITIASVLCSCLAVGGSYRALTPRLSTSSPGEVSGPLSAYPFTIEAPSFGPTPPCDTAAVGCSCCHWAPGTESGSTSFNLYRMPDLRSLRFGYGFECDQAGLVSSHALCCYPAPELGQVVGWLVQGVNLAGAGILGRDSQGNPIPAAAPCP